MADNVLNREEVLDSKKHDDKKSVISKTDLFDNSQILQSGGGEKNKTAIKKMIAIVIPLQSEKSWVDVHDGKDYGQMHFIVADNIYKAKEKFYKYLKDKEEDKVENVIIDTHGGGAGWIYLDNVDGTAEVGKNYYGIDNLKNLKKQNYRTRSNLISLRMILEKVKDNGNVIFIGCAMAKGQTGVKFMVEVHKFNYRTNTYVSEAYNYGTLSEDLPDNSYYSSQNTHKACINWKVTVSLDSGGTQSNEIGKGFKLMTAFKGIYYDLAKIGQYNGNLLINGNIGTIKY